MLIAITRARIMHLFKRLLFHPNVLEAGATSWSTDVLVSHSDPDVDFLERRRRSIGPESSLASSLLESSSLSWDGKTAERNQLTDLQNVSNQIMHICKQD